MQAVRLQSAQLGIDADDRIFVPSPLAHQTGFLYGMWLAWFVGAPQILQAVWDPERAVHMLREWRGSFIQAAPTFLADLVSAVQGGCRRPSTLRLFVPTGAAVPRSLAAQAEAVLRTQICGGFGTTEGCLATLAAAAEPYEKAAGSAGRALPPVRIRVVDDRGNALPAGVEGHLQIDSPTMFHGYLDEPDATAAAYTTDGWFRTADLAVMDADGFLHLRGRVNDVIKRGWEKVPVAQIEQLLYQHTAVKEIATVAMPDERLGERACAFVVPRSDRTLDLRAIQEFLDQQRVARPYWPERVELVAELPKTASGKIQRYVLRERARLLTSQRAPGTS